MFKYYFITCVGGGTMNLNDYIKNMTDLQNEIENINIINKKANKVLNCTELYGTSETFEFVLHLSNSHERFYLDTDLLFNALEQQKEKNEARLNEIKQEISKLQKESIQL